MGKILKLRRFDAAKKRKDGKSAYLGYFILLNGKRRSGKTTVAVDLMYHMQDDIDVAISMSPTSALSKCLKDIIPQSMQFPRGDPKYIQELMRQQEVRKRKGKPRQILLFLDDLAWDRGFMSSEGFKELIFDGRHLDITVIFTVQYCMVLPQELRMQCDLIITMKERSHLSKENLYKQFFGVMHMHEFIKVLAMCTKGYSALVLDNQSREEELSEFIFWFVANPSHAEKTRMGSEAIWELDKFYGMHEDEVQTAAAAEEVQVPTEREPIQVNDPAMIGETIDFVAMADTNGQTVVCKDVYTTKRTRGH